MLCLIKSVLLGANFIFWKNNSILVLIAKHLLLKILNPCNVCIYLITYYIIVYVYCIYSIHEFVHLACIGIYSLCYMWGIKDELDQKKKEKEIHGNSALKTY